MRAYNILHHSFIVDREYAESTWQAVDQYANKHPECLRKYLIAIPACKAKKPKSNKKKSKIA